MACFRPVPAYRTKAGDVSFDARKGDTDLKLPCGQCVGCRVGRARQWALRCVHEASLHKSNWFVTLTYAPAKVPLHGSLNYRDFQLFLKRLRKRTKRPIRYFVCGEYGEQLSRPHYHACMFGLDLPDIRPVRYLSASSGWTSKILESVWSLGHVHVGELNVRSAGYAARYCLKKVTGAAAAQHYVSVDGDGVVHQLEPEFARMSLRPGVGYGWFCKFRGDLRGDYVVHDGSKYGVPKYYDRLMEREDAEGFAGVVEEREVRALPFRSEQSPERLAVREIVEASRISTLKRKLES